MQSVELEVIPEPNDQLFIDLDGPGSVDEFCKRFACLVAIYTQRGLDSPFLEYQTNKSRNGNTHAVVTLAKIWPEVMKFFFRAILGSDPYREMHNLTRHIAGSLYPVVFFERGK